MFIVLQQRKILFKYLTILSNVIARIVNFIDSLSVDCNNNIPYVFEKRLINEIVKKHLKTTEIDYQLPTLCFELCFKVSWRM